MIRVINYIEGISITGRDDAWQKILYEDLTDIDNVTPGRYFFPPIVQVSNYKVYLPEDPFSTYFKIAISSLYMDSSVTCNLKIIETNQFWLIVWRETSPAEIVARIRIDDKTKIIKQLVGKDNVRCIFVTTAVYDVLIGDFFIFCDTKYYVNTLPDIKKISTTYFEYDILFEREFYDSSKVQFRL